MFVGDRTMASTLLALAVHICVRGSAGPCWGAYKAHLDPLAGFKGREKRDVERKERDMKGGKGSKKKEVREERKQRGGSAFLHFLFCNLMTGCKWWPEWCNG